MDNSRNDQMPYVARAIAAVGSGAFAEALAAIGLDLFGFDSLFISVFSRDTPPRQLFSNLDAEATRRTIGPYLSYAYLLDPFYELYRSGVGNRVVSLDECAPDDFRNSEYFKVFYSDIGLRNEVTLFVDAGNGASIVLSLGQRRKSNRPDVRPGSGLHLLLPVIAALCNKNWPNPAARPVAAADDSPDKAVTQAFERFQANKLSAREAEIVRLILKGHSTKSTARLLGNSPETVKVHRKRIYAKLKISSQGELFSMFLGALAEAQPANQPVPQLPVTAEHDAPRLLH